MIITTLLTLIYKHTCIKELDLTYRYGHNSWVCITDGSNGLGKTFAIKFAKKNFNILLIGNNRIHKLKSYIEHQFPKIECKTIVKNYTQIIHDNFFDDITRCIEDIDLSILINNVDVDVGWIPYHQMPVSYINNSVMIGTIMQTRMLHLSLPKFIKRSNKFKSGIINITDKCFHPNFGITDNDVTKVFKPIYNGISAYKYFHSESIYKEYKHFKYDDFLDYLTITNGVVRLDDFSIHKITYEDYVNNVVKFMGNVQGSQSPHYMDTIFYSILNFVPFIKDNILYHFGETDSNQLYVHFMLKIR